MAESQKQDLSTSELRLKYVNAAVELMAQMANSTGDHNAVINIRDTAIRDIFARPSTSKLDSSNPNVSLTEQLKAQSDVYQKYSAFINSSEANNLRGALKTGFENATNIINTNRYVQMKQNINEINKAGNNAINNLAKEHAREIQNDKINFANQLKNMKR